MTSQDPAPVAPPRHLTGPQPGPTRASPARKEGLELFCFPRMLMEPSALTFKLTQIAL